MNQKLKRLTLHLDIVSGETFRTLCTDNAFRGLGHIWFDASLNVIGTSIHEFIGLNVHPLEFLEALVAAPPNAIQTYMDTGDILLRDDADEKWYLSAGHLYLVSKQVFRPKNKEQYYNGREIL